MDNVFIDPVILTTPSEDASREAVEAYLKHLTLWLQEALTSPHTWLHFSRATELLINAGHFPAFPLLQAWQRKYRLDVSIQQISRRINQFFQNKDFDVDAKLGYLIEPEENSIIIRPEQFMRWHEAIHGEVRSLLATTCACKQAGEELAAKLNIATLFLTEAPEKMVQVSAIISTSVPDLELDNTRSISQTFPLLFTPDDLPFLNDIIPLWKQGEESIQYAVNRQCRDDWKELAETAWEYHLGPHFITSIKEAGLETNQIVLIKIIRAVAAIIVDKAKEVAGYELHPFRESDAGNSPQRSRPGDNAKAWRLTLTKEGAGWRLHYWQIPAGGGQSRIELSNVEKEQGSRKIY